MVTLVIHAPHYRAAQGAKSFHAVLATGIGDGYAIFQKDHALLTQALLNPGCKVVLLEKDKRQLRAEGYLVHLLPTGKSTPQGVKRYDVVIRGLRVVPYKAEKLNHFGVGVYQQNSKVEN